jgi:hypothetical protein
MASCAREGNINDPVKIHLAGTATGYGEDNGQRKIEACGTLSNADLHILEARKFSLGGISPPFAASTTRPHIALVGIRPLWQRLRNNA